MEMEMEILVILSVLVLTVSLYLFRALNSKYAGRNEAGHHHQLQLPPGSSGWPIIGEGLSFMMTARRGVPEKFIEDRRTKYSSSKGSCKVFITSLMRESVAVLCTAAGNKFLFSNEKKLVHSWWPENIYTIFPGLHKDSMTLRKVMSHFFSPKCLQKYVGIMDAFTKRHMDEFWSDEEQVKVHALAKKHTFTVACKIFLNVEDPAFIAKLDEPIQHIAPGFISTFPINLPGTPFNRAIRASKLVTKDLQEIVERKRIDLDRYGQTDLDDNNHQDLMSKLVQNTYSNGRQMKETDIPNIVDELKGLLIGGSDNTVTTICSMVMFLFHLPTVYDAVLKEQMEIVDSKSKGELLNWDDIQKMKYTWNVACEVLRMEPPNPGTFREAITDFVYEGYHIPKGMKLYWSVFSTHKNPEYFPDPEKFDPSRFEGEGPAPYSYVPFGGGPRMCPGREYARLTILVFMHNLVTRFKWEMIFPDEKMVMSPFLVPTRGLPVRLYPLK